MLVRTIYDKFLTPEVLNHFPSNFWNSTIVLIEFDSVSPVWIVLTETKDNLNCNICAPAGREAPYR